VAVTVAGDGSTDLLSSAGQNGRRMQRRDARHAVEVGRVQGEDLGHSISRTTTLVSSRYAVTGRVHHDQESRKTCP
jgi:hypothetical protein